MKANLSFLASLTLSLTCFCLFTFCNRNSSDSGRRDSTNSADKTTTNKIPTEYEPTNQISVPPKHKKDTVRNNRTIGNNEEIDFNSTSHRKTQPAATNGTRPGPENSVHKVNTNHHIKASGTPTVEGGIRKGNKNE